MLRLPELSGPYRYVWHHVLFTVSKSYLREPPLFLLRGAESLWGDDTMKCPLWMTWVQGKEPADGPAPATRAGSASESESEKSWSWLRPAEQTLPLPAIVRFIQGRQSNGELSPQLTPSSYSCPVFVFRQSNISSNIDVPLWSSVEAPPSVS